MCSIGVMCFCLFRCLAPSFGYSTFLTFDKTRFTFNPIGEFWIVKSSSINIQARFVQARYNGKLVQACVFGAIAAEDATSSRIHVQYIANPPGIHSLYPFMLSNGQKFLLLLLLLLFYIIFI